MQHFLTASIELIFFTFSLIFLFDLAITFKKCWVASALTPQTKLEIKAIAQVLPDPWTLPREPVVSKPQHQPFSTIHSKPLLLLPPAKEIPTSLFLDVDIDNLQLRQARKIAKALGIAQKVNKKDQPLSWLRAQIKAKLQQPQELPETAILAVREFLAS